MGWIYVILAGIIELFWVLGLKLADGFWSYTLVAAFIVASFFVLSQALKTLPISIVYAVFTGIGTVGIVIIQTLYLHIPMTPTKALFIALIAGGIVGLRLIGNKPKTKGE